MARRTRKHNKTRPKGPRIVRRRSKRGNQHKVEMREDGVITASGLASKVSDSDVMRMSDTELRLLIVKMAKAIGVLEE